MLPRSTPSDPRWRRPWASVSRASGGAAFFRSTPVDLPSACVRPPRADPSPHGRTDEGASLVHRVGRESEEYETDKQEGGKR